MSDFSSQSISTTVILQSNLVHVVKCLYVAIDFYIKIHDGGHYVSISLSDKDGNVTPAPEDQRRRLDHYGEVSLYPPDDYHGNCSGAWMVGSSEAMKGWGPFLYDVAIEYATLRGNGLMPDREMVSGEAKRVWDYYLKNRSDVTAHQLDNLEDYVGKIFASGTRIAKPLEEYNVQKEYKKPNFSDVIGTVLYDKNIHRKKLLKFYEERHGVIYNK